MAVNGSDETERDALSADIARAFETLTKAASGRALEERLRAAQAEIAARKSDKPKGGAR